MSYQDQDTDQEASGAREGGGPAGERVTVPSADAGSGAPNGTARDARSDATGGEAGGAAPAGRDTTGPTATPPTHPERQVSRRPVRRTPLFEASQSARYGRQGVIRDIEGVTGTNLLCIVSTVGQIHRMHTAAVVDLLHNVPEGAPIDLLLNSPGGDIDTAEKLISLVRKRAGKAAVRVIVADFAKSAATLVALGADTVVMSDTSELGPIDPQVTLEGAGGVKTTHSAQSYIDAYDKLAEQLRENPGDPVATLMLDKLDPVVLEKLRRIAKRSTAIATDLLTKSMISDLDAAAKAAEALSDTGRWHSHGQMIGHEQCVGVGLDVTYLHPESDLWQSLWRLYCLQSYSLSEDFTLFESNVASNYL